jgi:hypothetical protein
MVKLPEGKPVGKGFHDIKWDVTNTSTPIRLPVCLSVCLYTMVKLPEGNPVEKGFHDI